MSMWAKDMAILHKSGGATSDYFVLNQRDHYKLNDSYFQIFQVQVRDLIRKSTTVDTWNI